MPTNHRLRHFKNSTLFLQDYYHNKKSQNEDFSYEIWARQLGAKNKSYLRYIVLGRRPINESMLQAFSEYFSFTEEDREYFQTIVYYTQSKNKEQRLLFGKKLASLLTGPDERIEISNHIDFLSDQILPKLLTVCGFEDAPFSIGELGEIFELSDNEVRQKLCLLERMELLKDGKAIIKSWRVPSSFQTLGHKEFYLQSFRNAEKAMELPFDERKFHSLFVGMTGDDFKDFMGDFNEFLKEQYRKRDVAELSGRRLYQLTFNFFPVSKVLKAE